jgi:hypothetical protein
MRPHAFLAVLALPIVVASGLDDRAIPTTPAGCTTAQHRQFDFWLGDWQVHAGGKVAGRNRITLVAGGCALLEQWEGAGGVTGTSVSAYSAADGRWRQWWVDAQGGTLDVCGQWDEASASMRMSGTSVDEGGRSLQNEITWQRLDDGNVRQRWRTSADKGATWQDVFDGLYRK